MNKSTVTEKINAIYDETESTTAVDLSLPGVHQPLVPAINFSSAYFFDNEDALANYHDNKHILQRYSRDSNPIVAQLEKILSGLYDRNSILFSSGMSAIWSVLWSIAPSTRVFATIGSFYRKTLVNIEDICAATGGVHKNFDSFEALKKSCTDSEDLCLIIESPSNPFLGIVDLSELRSLFPKAVIVYDNTFAGLLNDKHDLSEIDFVVSSCTKYISGHNDVIAGVVWSSDEEKYYRLWDIRSAQGGILDPMTAYLLFRSLKTYDVRMERCLDNCQAVLAFIDDCELIDEVYYPGHGQNIKQEPIFSESYFNGGSVITFRVLDTVDVSTGLSTLHSTKMAPSFGSTDTLIERPATMSHAGKTEDELKQLGLTMHHVRMSVGMEPIKFILSDLERLLGIGQHKV